MLRRMPTLGLFFVLILGVAACAKNSQSTSKAPDNEARLLLIDDSRRYHLGENFKEDLVIQEPWGREHTYTFGLRVCHH